MKPQANPSTPLYDLLIECCRHEPSNVKLEEYAEKIINWNAFLESAYAHGVYPLVAKALKPISTVPESVKLILKSTNLDIARRNMMMTSELLRMMQLLEEHGIKALAIKGPVLSQIIHGDVTIRQYADIDVLISAEQIYHAAKVLIDHGYTSEYNIEFLNNKTLLDVAKDFSIFNVSQNIHIEFHWQLFLTRQIKKSQINLFSSSNPTCTINTQKIRTLGEDENLIYLLLHGSKHMWERLEWIVDINRLICAREGAIDWDQLCNLAKDMEIEVMFYLGLTISDELFQTPLPKYIYAKIESIPAVLMAKKVILEELYANGILIYATELTPFKNLFKMRLNKDSSTAVIRHYWKTLFGLKYFDVYMINLPNQLAFLYHFIRLYRLFKLYVLRIKNR